MKSSDEIVRENLRGAYLEVLNWNLLTKSLSSGNLSLLVATCHLKKNAEEKLIYQLAIIFLSESLSFGEVFPSEPFDEATDPIGPIGYIGLKQMEKQANLLNQPVAL